MTARSCAVSIGKNPKTIDGFRCWSLENSLRASGAARVEIKRTPTMKTEKTSYGCFENRPDPEHGRLHDHNSQVPGTRPRRPWLARFASHFFVRRLPRSEADGLPQSARHQ